MNIHHIQYFKHYVMSIIYTSSAVFSNDWFAFSQRVRHKLRSFSTSFSLFDNWVTKYNKWNNWVCNASKKAPYKTIQYAPFIVIYYSKQTSQQPQHLFYKISSSFDSINDKITVFTSTYYAFVQAYNLAYGNAKCHFYSINLTLSISFRKVLNISLLLFSEFWNSSNFSEYNVTWKIHCNSY